MSGLGHHIVWYMFTNVPKERSGSIFPGHWKIEEVCLE